MYSNNRMYDTKIELLVIQYEVVSVLPQAYSYTRVVQRVPSQIGFLGFIPGIVLNASLHLNGVLNS